MLVLRIIDEQGIKTQELFLGNGTHTIGRAPENTIIIKDMKASRLHAHFIIQDQQCWIVDQKSRWGTFVNEKKVHEKTELKEEDHLQIGNRKIEISWGKRQSTLASDHVAKLEIVEPAGFPQIYYLEKPEIVLGRVPECDIQVADKKVSRQHAKILLKDQAYYLEDLGSINGTLINDERKSNYRLCDGDRIQIGKFTYQFSFCSIDNMLATQKIPLDTVEGFSFRRLAKAAFGWGFTFSVLGIIAYGGHYYYHSFKEPSKAVDLVSLDMVNRNPISVAVAPWKKVTWQRTWTSIGEVLGEKHIEVTTEIPGKVKHIFVEEGDEVKKGQKLLEMDSIAWKDKLEEIKLERDKARALAMELKTVIPINKEKEEVVALRVETAKRMHQADRITKDQLLEAREKYLMVQEANKKLQHNYRVLVKKIQILSEQGKKLSRRIKNSVITSPSPGIINKSYIFEGGPGQGTLLDITDVTRLSVTAKITKQQSSFLQKSDEVQIHSSLYPGVKIIGKINSIQKEEEFATVKIFYTSKKALRHGEYVHITFMAAKQENAIVALEKAILTEKNQSHVFVVDKNKEKHQAKKLEVNILGKEGRLVYLHPESFQDLPGESKVVVEGQLRLKPQDKIRITRQRSLEENS